MIKNSELIYKGFISLKNVLFKFTNLKGEETLMDREVLFENDSSNVILVDYKNQTLVFTKQQRPIKLINNEDPLSYEFVAGYIDDGETPEEAAIREVKEEIGIDIRMDSLEFICTSYCNLGRNKSKDYFYLASIDSEIIEAGSFQGEESEGEMIILEKMSFNEALDKLRRDEFDCIKIPLFLNYLKSKI